MTVPTICDTGFLNCTQTIGLVVQATTEQTTGTLFLTFLFVILILMAIAMMFKVPLEFTMILILPLTLALMAYYQNFLGVGAAFLIYLAVLMTKNWIIR